MNLATVLAPEGVTVNVVGLQTCSLPGTAGC